MPARIVQTKLIYASRDTKDGKKHWVEGGVSEANSNFDEDEYDCEVIDLTGPGISLEPSLDKTAFDILDYPSAEKDFRDESAITSTYYNEVQALLKRHCAASKIVIFDHTIRRPNTNRTPVARTHVDQTTKAAITRVRKHCPEEADELLKKRFQIINVWRPIENPAWNNPLAFCDYRSLHDGDMIETDRIDFSKPELPPGEVFSMAHNPAHKWYYHRNLGTDQVILIKCYDSKTDVGK